MAKKVSFALDTQAAGDLILRRMVMPTIRQRGNAVAARARSMANSISSNPPAISVSTSVGTIKRGSRIISTIKAEGRNPHENYVGHIALAKAKDAGRN